MFAGHMSRWRFSLIGFCIGTILGGIPLVAAETGKLEPWPACCLLVGMVTGLTIGSLIERLRPRRGATGFAPFSIANGIAFGFVTYASVELVAGRWREANPSVLVLR